MDERDSFKAQLMDAAINDHSATLTEPSKENGDTLDECKEESTQGQDKHIYSKPVLTQHSSEPLSALRNRVSRQGRRDRLGTLIHHDPHDFESEFKGTPPVQRKRKTFQVTFKDKAEGGSLAKVVEVESYKKYNSLDPEVKL